MPKDDRRRTLARSFEPLEGRTLLATSALDPTFGSRGLVLGAIDNGSGTELSDASAVAVLAGGKILVAGTVARPGSVGGSAAAYPSVALRRYNADGSPDASFGTGGQVNVSLPSPDTSVTAAPRNLAIQPDGKIVFAVAASSISPSVFYPGGTPPSRTVVYRLNADGSPDAGFGTAGASVAVGNNDLLTDVAVQADGKILAAGGSSLETAADAFLARLNADGSLDSSFAASGTFSVAGSKLVSTTVNQSITASGVVGVEADGSIAFGFNVFNNYGFSEVFNAGRIIWLNASGAVDTSKGAGGITSGIGSTANALAIQPDGKVLLVGSNGLTVGIAGSTQSPAAASAGRVNPDGSVDSTFKYDAGSLNNVGTRYDAVAIQADGKVVVAGASEPNRGSAVTRFSRLIVDRLDAGGSVDTTFGLGGRVATRVPIPTISGPTLVAESQSVNGVALTSTGQVIVAGTASDASTVANSGSTQYVSESVLARLNTGSLTRPMADDYDGDGKADLAALLPTYGYFAYRPSGGGPDVSQPFGSAGFGNAVPAPGDYDGDGKSDLAVYLPAIASLAYRPSSGGPDVFISFGAPGQGRSIPAPGDYDGDGKADAAVYLPSQGLFAYRPSSGGADVLIPFGVGGEGASIPAPGDFDGDGVTDVALSLSYQGVFAYRPSSGGADVLTPFGDAGAGRTVPTPADFDGDGKADLAVYLPYQGLEIYRPSSGGRDVVTPFGVAGQGATIAAIGDEDGDGKADVTVYIPSQGIFAYRASTTGRDVVTPFGIPGTDQTVPAGSIPYAFSTATGPQLSLQAEAVAAQIPLTDDLAAEVFRSGRKARKG